MTSHWVLPICQRDSGSEVRPLLAQCSSSRELPMHKYREKLDLLCCERGLGNLSDTNAHLVASRGLRRRRLFRNGKTKTNNRAWPCLYGHLSFLDSCAVFAPHCYSEGWREVVYGGLSRVLNRSACQASRDMNGNVSVSAQLGFTLMTINPSSSSDRHPCSEMQGNIGHNTIPWF